MASSALENFDFKPEVLRAAARNWRLRTGPRRRNDEETRAGRPESIESMERMVANNTYRQAAAQRVVQAEMSPAPAALMNSFAQERIVGGGGFLDVAFLELGMAVARFVGRIQVQSQPNRPLGYGTGFMVSPRLLLTNNHVLGDRDMARNSIVQFDYQKDRMGNPLPIVACGLEPDTFFLTNGPLDFTLVAVSPFSTDGRIPLNHYSWIRMRADSGKALLGDSLNIIQHPQGELKQLVLRQNKLIDNFGHFVQYQTDTLPGSSGSPVLSDTWDLVALHHSGIPKTDDNGNFLANDGQIWVAGRDDPARLSWSGNEGIRISSLIDAIKNADIAGSKDELRRQLLEDEPPTPIEIATMAKNQQPEPAIPLGSSSNGEVSFTIPVRVTVSLGNPFSSKNETPAIQSPPAMGEPRSTAIGQPSPPGGTGGISSTVPPNPPSPSDSNRASTAIAMIGALTAAKAELLRRPDVLRVDLGYVFDESNWITDKRAIIVTLKPQSGFLKTEANYATLPSEVQGIPVRAVDPSIEDLVLIARGSQTAESAFRPRTINFDEITYTPPSGIPLDEVTAMMRVVAHVSPETGWTQLQEFLDSTEKTLVVGMYDFGAPHIEEAVESLADKRSFDSLKLVLQRGESLDEGVKADDFTDAETVKKLAKAFKNKTFDQAWVKIGPVNGWVAYSYHIKVAVRDSNAFWLSSGNWQSSNQPERVPSSRSEIFPFFKKYNREWHAIVEHDGLATTFQKYIENDYDHNIGASGQEELALPDIFWPSDIFAPELEAAPQAKFFPPFVANRKFTVRPLLTPDGESYHKYVLELVQSAQSELLFQNQTFNAPRDQDANLRELVDAILKKQQDGVNVKIIFRLFDRTAAQRNVEALKDYGFDTSKIKLQVNCHTKGIVVDRKRVLIGSHNWSNAGVSTNRDASLLFEDEELAKYFAEIFDHDWTLLAKASIGARTRSIELAPANVAEPPMGMVRLTWKDYMEAY